MRRPWLLVVLLAALAMWFWRQPRYEAPDTGNRGNRGPVEPGYVATGAIMLETGNDGRPLYRLRADRISQLDPGADIELASPQFQYEGPTVWTVTARTGTLPPSQQQVRLAGDVVARGDQVGADPMELHTATLTVDLQTRLADTLDPVTMEWGANRLSASGLHADMQADYLRLKSPVHGEFAHAIK